MSEEEEIDKLQRKLEKVKLEKKLIKEQQDLEALKNEAKTNFPTSVEANEKFKPKVTRDEDGIKLTSGKYMKTWEVWFVCFTLVAVIAMAVIVFYPKKQSAEEFAREYLVTCARKDVDRAWEMLTPLAQATLNKIASMANSFGEAGEKVISGKELHVEDPDDPSAIKLELMPVSGNKGVYKMLIGKEAEGEHKRFVVNTGNGWKIDFR